MELYYLCSENKGADQLRGYHEADLRLCFHRCKNRFSHDEAHLTFKFATYKYPSDPEFSDRQGWANSATHLQAV